MDNTDRNTTQQRQTSGPHRPHKHQRQDRRTDDRAAHTTGTLDGAPGGRAERADNGAIKWEAFGQTVYVRDATKHPPGASYTTAVIIGLFCLFAIGWQANTTFTAFSNMIFDGTIWQHMNQSGQDGARMPVNIICLMIAVSFQAPLLFMGFKIDKRWASERHKRLTMASKATMILHLTGEIIAGNLLLSIWAILALVADTLGDVGFLNTFTNNSVVLFFYATGLYGLSTVGLSECLQLLWDGMVTSEWLKYVRIANAAAMLKVREMEEAMKKRTAAGQQNANSRPSGQPARGASQA